MVVRKLWLAVCGSGVMGLVLFASAVTASAQHPQLPSRPNPLVTDPNSVDQGDFANEGPGPIVEPTSKLTLKSFRPRHPNAELVTDGFVSRDGGQ